jgi:hypothetical protein
MSRHRIGITALVVGLAFGGSLLAATPATAAGRGEPAPASAWSGLWLWIEELVGVGAHPSSSARLGAPGACQAGCSSFAAPSGTILDPNGIPASGGVLDPNGQPASGGVLDPDGKPVS